MSETADRLQALAGIVQAIETAGASVRVETAEEAVGALQVRLDVTIDEAVDVVGELETVAETTAEVRENTVARAEAAGEDDQDDAPEPADPERSPGAAAAEPAITEADGSVETPDVTENGHDVDDGDADDEGDQKAPEPPEPPFDTRLETVRAIAHEVGIEPDEWPTSYKGNFRKPQRRTIADALGASVPHEATSAAVTQAILDAIDADRSADGGRTYLTADEAERVYNCLVGDDLELEDDGDDTDEPGDGADDEDDVEPDGEREVAADVDEAIVDAVADATDDADGIQTKGFADAMEGEGEDEPETYPAECSCGIVCNDSVEYYVHRQAAHRVDQSHLPHEPGAFPEYVERAETVGELKESLGISTVRTLRLLAVYGLGHLVGSGEDLPNGVEPSGDLLTLGPDAAARNGGTADGD